MGGGQPDSQVSPSCIFYPDHLLRQIQIQIQIQIFFQCFFLLDPTAREFHFSIDRCHFFLSFFQLCIKFCDLLKYSGILCLAEVLWNLVGNFVWNIALSQKTALIYSEISRFIRILHLGYHWKPHFFCVNSWTMHILSLIHISEPTRPY